MCYLISISAIGFDESLPEHFHAYKTACKSDKKSNCTAYTGWRAL
jgi:hypothetical protein